MIGLSNGYVYGYIYNKERYHTPPIKMSIKPSNIASFIVRCSDSPLVIITNTNDLTEIRVEHGFVMECNDQEYLKNELLPVLLPMQHNRKKIGEFKALGYGVDASTFSDEYMINWIKEKFDVNLGEGISA